MNIHIRIKKVLDYLGYEVPNKSKVANKLGIKSQTLSKIYNGTIPKADLLEIFATAVSKEINSHWLLTGEGEMLKANVNIKGNNFINATTVGDSTVNYKSSSSDLENKYKSTIDEQNKLIIKLQTEVSELKDRIIEMLQSQNTK